LLKNLYFASIYEVSQQMREQKISPVELVQASLDRIEKLNPQINAFITILADEALQQARTAEIEINAGSWRGPLHGIPVGIKDMYDTAGVRTTAAFEHFQNRVPSKDAVAVRKLKQSGAIIIGKMNMHELAMGTTSVTSYFGAVHNPWNLDHIAGGSSGGSAAAVASGMCFATLDTDAIGSCRLPAACCGVTGFKGTYALISEKGVLEGEPVDETILWLAHAALTTRSAADTALLLNVLAENLTGSGQKVDFFEALKKDEKPRIGVVTNFTGSEEMTGVFQACVKTLQDLGYSTRQVEVPFDRAGFDIHSIQADRQAITASLFKDIDVLALPTTTAPVPAIKDVGENSQALSPQNTLFANYYGLPAISIPCGFDRAGLPVGLQIVGNAGQDQVVLGLANQFQNETAWSKQHPVN
jgi:aspartyl-tRNA(Asn)/glutamyl-tRNA(Gln) amidotransferase subunit A